ncbi:MAG: diacylglycerol kinase family lipid kinase [Chitinophagales bacterium]
MKKVAFLINKVIKRYRQIVSDIEAEFMYSTDCKLFISEKAGHIKELASEAVREGYDYLIVVGGDGTINEVINGMTSRYKVKEELSSDSFDWQAIQKIKIGLLPAGSGNDFARYHQLKYDIKYLKFLIEKDKVKPLDVGYTTFNNQQNQQVERFFSNITDVGMGGHTVQHMDRHKVGWLGSNLNYTKAILSSFITYDKSTIKWTSDQASWQGKIMSMVVANGKYFGSGLAVAPDAKMDDGKFTLVTLGNITMLDYLQNLGKVKKGEPIVHKEVSYTEAKEVTIEPLDGKELPIDMDGDFVGYCPMTLKCITKSISFLIN